MYNQVIENHPGIYNESDLSFKENLDNAFYAANQDLHNNINQKLVIERFAKSFDDVHVWVHWHANKIIELKNNASAEFIINTISPKIVWVNLPTFSLSKAQNIQYTAILKTISNYKNHSLIVFDLRGNQGGNSDYGSKLIDCLFGKLYANARRSLINQKITVDWRVSVENLEHIQKMNKNHGFKWTEGIAKGMQISLSNNEHYYHQRSSGAIDHEVNILNNTVKAKIVVIIDQQNMSAALDFIDELKMMSSQVILVGKTTKADRLYMEVKTVELPSGLGTFSFPIKVYRNRPRGDKIPYTPDYEQDTKDTKKLENFIIKIMRR